MKPKFIIVEGPDGMGKTTLAKFFTRRLRAFYFHATAKDIQNDQAGYLHNILDNAEVNIGMHNCSVVLDRHWPSETTYGPVLRPGKEHKVSDLFSRCISLNVQYVFCMPLNSNSLLRFIEKQTIGDANLNQYKKIVDNYKEIIDKMKKDLLNPAVYYVEEHGSDLESFLNSL